MNPTKLREAILALKEAGKRFHIHELDPCDERGVRTQCACGADRHNAAVEAAFAEALAELENLTRDFGSCPGCGQAYLGKSKVCGNPRCNRDCLHE